MTAQDKELFSQLYDRNYKRLLYAAIRIARNPFTAEELTNEAFTILLTHFDRVRQHYQRQYANCSDSGQC